MKLISNQHSIRIHHLYIPLGPEQAPPLVFSKNDFRNPASIRTPLSNFLIFLEEIFKKVDAVAK